MATAVGSSIFYIFALLAIFLLVFILIRYYLPRRDTPAFLVVPVFLAIVLPANLLLLLPIDLASNPVSGDAAPKGIWLPQRAVLVAWRVTYWLTFGLTWFILPLLGEFMDAGHREYTDKFIYSLTSNAKYQAIVMSCATIGGFYFLYHVDFNYRSMVALVMALAYTWGLLLAIYLMSHGLVALPRRLIVYADPRRKLRNLQSKAKGVYDKSLDAAEELQVYENEVRELSRLKTPSATMHSDWIQELVEDCKASGVHGNRLPSTNPGANAPVEVTIRYLAGLSRTLQRARHMRTRCTSEWRLLVAEANRLQIIMEARRSGSLVFPSTNSQTALLTPSLRYKLHAWVYPTISYVSGGFLAIASLSIIWSEVTKTILQRTSLISFSVVPSPEFTVRFFPSQVFAAFWVAYMSLCALYTVTVVPAWGNRALVYRTTYPESATWYAAQVAKLTVPLAYNFLTFLPQELREKTMFYHFLGSSINLTPLGRQFSSFFPILILFPTLAALFGWYDSIKQVLGFEDWLAENEREDQWVEGQDLIRQHSIQSVEPYDPSGSDSRDVSLDFTRPLLDEYDPPPRNNEAIRAAISRSQSTPINSSRSSTGRSRFIPALSPLRSASPALPRPASVPPSRASRATATATPIRLPDDDEPANPIVDFAHRIKNTISLIERPSWLPWGDGDETNTDQSGRNSIRTNPSRGLGLINIFGGGNSESPR